MTAHCDDCPLRDKSSAVPASHGDSDVLILTDQPSEAAAKHCAPMVGGTARMLQHAVKQAGLEDRMGDATVATAVACRRPNGRAPLVKQIRACSDRLDELLEGKSLVVALGKKAIEAVYEDRPLNVTDKRLGPVDTIERGGREIDVLATYSPGAVLRSPRRQGDLVKDLEKAHGGYGEWTDPAMMLAETGTEAINTLAELTGAPTLVADIESADAPDAAMHKPERVTCVGLTDTTDGWVLVIPEPLLDDLSVRDALSRAMVESGRLVAHNGMYDLGVLEDHHGIQTGPLGGDTMLAAYALDERRGGKGLQALARELLGAPAWKADMDYGNPNHRLFQYNARDVHSTALLWETFETVLESKGLMDLHHFLCRSSDTLRRIKARGMLADTDELERQHAEAVEAEQSAEAALDLNPRSPKQITEALADMGVHVNTTNADCLRDLKVGTTKSSGIDRLEDGEIPDEAAELAEQVLTYRQSAKLVGTYLGTMPDHIAPDGRVYTSLALHTTETGRLSASEPNLQNQPAEVARIFVPTPGNVFVSGDLNSAEARVLANESRDESLRDVINGDRKIHDIVAEEIWGPDYAPERYRQAKTVVYGVPYGRSAYGMAMGLGIPVKQAKGILRSYFERFPAVKEWQDEIRKRVRRGKDLSTPFGRRMRMPGPGSLVPRKQRRQLERSALAFYPQSIASDICLTAANMLDDGGWPVVMLVHDDIVLDVAPDRAQEACASVRAAVRAAGREYTDWIEFTADPEVTQRWHGEPMDPPYTAT